MASPGGVTPGQCHCSQRPELVKDPSSSAKQVEGSWIHFSLDRRRIDVIDVAMLFPEPRALRVERIHDNEEFQLGQRVGDFLPVRERLQRVEALAEIAGHLALVHQLEGPENVIGRDIHLRQPIIGEVIVRPRRVSVHGFLEADEELLGVLPITRLARPQRLISAGFHISGEINLLLGGQQHIARQHV